MNMASYKNRLYKNYY